MSLTTTMDQSQSDSLMRPQIPYLTMTSKWHKRMLKNTEIDSLANNTNVDSDNITIRITGVTDKEMKIPLTILKTGR